MLSTELLKIAALIAFCLAIRRYYRLSWQEFITHALLAIIMAFAVEIIISVFPAVIEGVKQVLQSAPSQPPPS